MSSVAERAIIRPLQLYASAWNASDRLVSWGPWFLNAAAKRNLCTAACKPLCDALQWLHVQASHFSSLGPAILLCSYLVTFFTGQISFVTFFVLQTLVSIRFIFLSDRLVLFVSIYSVPSVLLLACSCSTRLKHHSLGASMSSLPRLDPDLSLSEL